MTSQDPFSSLPDVAAYQPRPATERALDALVAAVRRGDRPVVLEGPPGIGKTLLLHVLSDRLRSEVRVVSVPIPTLATDELWHWVVASLGDGADAGAEALARSVQAGPPVLLLIDDANALPVETVEALAEALESQRPALRAVLVASDDEVESAELLFALGTPIERVALFEPMSEAECTAYICERLAAAGADATTRARFDDAMLSRLHAHSGGLPSVVHELADLLVRPDEAARAHELAAELRPDTVARAAARRSRDSVERIGEWGDEDLARAVAARGRPAPARDPEPMPSVAAAEAAPVVPREASLAAERERPAKLAASPASAAPPTGAASAPASSPASTSQAAAAPASRPVAPAAPSASSAPTLVPLALGVAVVAALGGLALWGFGVGGEAPPTHKATFVNPAAAREGSVAEEREENAAAPQGAASTRPESSAPATVAPSVVATIAAEDDVFGAAAPGDGTPLQSGEVPAVEDASGSTSEFAAVVSQAVEEARETAAGVEAPQAAVAEAAPAADSEAAPLPEPDAAPAREREVASSAGAGDPAARESGDAVVSTPSPSPTPDPAPREAPAREPAPEAEPPVEATVPPALAGQRPPAEIAVARGAERTHLAQVIAAPGTRIEIDDAARGVAPLAAVALSEGEHRVRWTRLDGSARERVFVIDADHRVLDLRDADASDEATAAERDGEGG